MYPDSINNLIEVFKRLPGVGQKSAERMVFSLIDSFDNDDYDNFSNSIDDIKNNIKFCSKCNSITDDDLCYICKDKTRNKDSLIIVENFKDVFLMEKTESFNGYYHVLGGFISPFDGIGPDDIKLESLIKRIKTDNVKEIIFVVKSCIEADTTILYIKKILEGQNVKISRVANGIPVGADMDYIDSLTLESALNNRHEVVANNMF